MTDLLIEAKITIFRTLTISKVVHLGLIAIVPAFAIEELNIIKKTLFGKPENPKQNTLLYKITTNKVLRILIHSIK